MRFISILEYAYLSNAVYYNKNTAYALPSVLTHMGWSMPVPINDMTNFQSDFFGRLYLKSDDKNKVEVAVVAFRGTMPIQHPENDISDFKMAVLHQLPLHYEAALVFFHKARWYVRENYPNAEIKLTGHSLGGALAQLVAAKSEQLAVTFNSPGIGELPDIQADKTYSRIHNINAKDDIISKIGKSIGTIQTVEVTAGEKQLAEASIIEKEMLTSLVSAAVIAGEETVAGAERAEGYFEQHAMENMIAALQHHTLSNPPVFY